MGSSPISGRAVFPEPLCLLPFLLCPLFFHSSFSFVVLLGWHPTDPVSMTRDMGLHAAEGTLIWVLKCPLCSPLVHTPAGQGVPLRYSLECEQCALYTHSRGLRSRYLLDPARSISIARPSRLPPPAAALYLPPRRHGLDRFLFTTMSRRRKRNIG